MPESMPITARDPSEILKPSCLAAYEEAMDLVWRDVLRLNSYIFVLGKLLRFHTDTEYFLGPGRQTFLKLVNTSFTESSLLLITRLTSSGRTRRGKTESSLPLLRNWIGSQVKPEFEADFRRLLKEIGFKSIVRDARESVRLIRDRVIAHLEVDENWRPKLSVRGFAFPELGRIAGDLTKLFDALCFGHERLTLPVHYSPAVQHPEGSDSRSDIEYFLDLIIQDSHLFKAPDVSPYWDVERKGLSSEALDKLNEYRRKLGKPEA